MIAVFPILAMLVIFGVSLLVIRVGSLALVMTGLSPEVASFQAQSAFSGAGFTTDEAEKTVETPARRKIIKSLIRLGSVGLVSAITSLVASFTQSVSGSRALFLLATGVLGIVALARSRWLNRLLTPVLRGILRRRTRLEPRDYTRLLHMHDDYRVAEFTVSGDSWLADSELGELDLPEEGVVVLGVLRGDEYDGAPSADAEIRPDDKIIAYGRANRLRELSERSASEGAFHELAVEDHEGTRAV